MRIMTLATYRIDDPRHGGQIRLNAIHRVFGDAGWITRHLAVQTGSAAPDAEFGSHVFTMDTEYQWALASRSGRADVEASEFLLGNPQRFAEAVLAIDEFQPDCIWLEQPWLWEFVKKYRSERRNSVTLIYGSQNHESALFRRLLADAPDAVRSRLVAKVDQIEGELCRRADAIVGVSEQDLAALDVEGKPQLLAKNGVWPRPRPTGIEFWREELRHLSVALFVGSAHPPNADGFFDIVGDDLGYISPVQVIVVAGGVGDLLRERYLQRHGGLALARLIIAGQQDAGGLSTLIELSDAILLPITGGGGTNLKTAEALYNRKPIIATSVAMRGYEDYLQHPGVTIHDDPQAFRKAVHDLLGAPGQQAPDLKRADEARLDRLLWSATLRELPRFVETLSAGRAGQHRSPVSKPDLTRLPPSRFHTFLTSGWHDHESAGAWTNSVSAIAAVPRSVIQIGDNKVTLLIEAFVPKGKKLTLDVFTPSGHQGTLVFSRTKRKQTISFTIVEQDFDGDVTEFYFETDAIYSPAMTSSSKDERRIGVRVVDAAFGTGANALRLGPGGKATLVDRLARMIGPPYPSLR